MPPKPSFTYAISALDRLYSPPPTMTPPSTSAPFPAIPSPLTISQNPPSALHAAGSSAASPQALPYVCLSITAVPPPRLRRNQACRQYRKRKLICDAQKPQCSTCVKQWNAQIAVPPPVGFSYLPQPLCMYDRMKGLGLTPLNADQVDDPKQRLNLLES
ncbi:hypothetical protein M407DRAFT_26135 [Tulasnella calospora MUT 4182]|uniref:Zn(2)-C6 fungal-type domain-containing protein n=1 Tax=Tulasnella calospora MUT 4182 TaxID=1051891 RepID=A0A0C3QG72_9AGAM|nr:hypothetical protein M407DRAFT_26135 [Tulasnella calospora MUT 4182]